MNNKSASNNPRIRILIATGIFPPNIGGPALYGQKLAENFSKKEFDVSVFTYGSNSAQSDKYKVYSVASFWPYGLRQFIYFLKLLPGVREADAIFALDSLGAGLPAILAGKLFGKKVVLRLGGDFLWEKFVESGNERMTMVEFYNNKKQENFPVLFWLIKFVLKNSDRIIFTTDFQIDIFVPNYDLDLNRISVIKNIFEKTEDVSEYDPGKRYILWAGRFIKLKNLKFLIAVFKRLSADNSGLILKLIGDGPEKENIRKSVIDYKLQDKVSIMAGVSESELSKEIKGSYFCVLPSLAEISPNFALKCISLNKPIVLTQETGIKSEFPGLLYADPKNEESFFQAMLRLLDENSYENYQRFISDIPVPKKDWDDLAEDYLSFLIK